MWPRTRNAFNSAQKFQLAGTAMQMQICMAVLPVIIPFSTLNPLSRR